MSAGLVFVCGNQIIFTLWFADDNYEQGHKPNYPDYRTLIAAFTHHNSISLAVKMTSEENFRYMYLIQVRIRVEARIFHEC